MIGLVRIRIALLGVAFVVLGATACGIFDSIEWALVVTPALPPLAVGAFARRGAGVRSAAAVVAVVAATAIAVVSVGGDVGDVGAAFGAGLQRVLSTEWPSPVRADLVGTIAADLAILAAIATLLAAARRWHLLPLLPVLIAYAGVIALSAPLGFRPVGLIVLSVIGIAFALIRVDGSVRERWLLLRGERRLIGLIALAGFIAVAISSSVSFASRSDPRRDEPAQDTAALLDPIEATVALRALDPPIDLHEVTPTGDGPQVELPVRWRTAALEEYDGRRWSPVLTLRPIGNTLGPVTGDTIDASITFLDDDLRLVPLAGSPVSVSVAVETDRDRTVVRLVDRPTPGDAIGVVSNIAVDASTIEADAAVMPRPVDETVAGLTGLAQSLGGAGVSGNATLIDQLRTIEQTMRDDFVLDSGVTGGGLQRALIDRFLRDTQRGNTEQFATAFVLLARSLGADARVATGFVVDESSAESLMLTSADAVVWPEVALLDGSWIAFDPVPAEESTDPAPPEPEPEVQTPAAPQPPIAPPPESEDTSSDDEPVPEVDDAFSTATLWATRAVVTVTVVLLPLLLATGLVLGVKFRRRRRRRRLPDPAARIQGAWASATDALVDAGLTIPASCTDDEIARRGDPIAQSARRELHRLAVLNGAATYGAPSRPDLLAEDAQQCLDAIDTAIVEPKNRWQRTRWRLSLRSLRRSTRSPVAV